MVELAKQCWQQPSLMAGDNNQSRAKPTNDNHDIMSISIAPECSLMLQSALAQVLL